MSDSPGRPLPSVHYASGSGTAVVGPRGLALVASQPQSPLVKAVTGPLEAGGDAAAVVEGLFVLGMDNLVPFACAVLDNDTVKVIVRGDVVVEATTGEGLESVDGSDSSTWLETRLRDVRSLTLRLAGESDDATFTLGQGTGPAAVVSVQLADSPDDADPTGPTTATSEEPVAVADAPAADISPTGDGGQTLSEAAGGDDDGDFDFGHLLGETKHRGVEDAAVRAEEEADSQAEEVSHELVQPADPASAPNPDETRVFDGTSRLPEPPSPPPADPEPDPASPEIDEAPAAEAPAGAGVQAPPAPTAGMISTVPGMGGQSPAAAPTEATPPPDLPPPPATNEPAATPAPPIAPSPLTAKTDLVSAAPAAVPPRAPTDAEDEATEDRTVRKSDLAAARAKAAATAAGGPTVQAVHCAAGHPNPVHADQCRSCQQPLTDRTISVITRPTLGHLTFSKGKQVPLDKPIVIGRRPPKEVHVEGERALPVAVGDPDKLLSRTHIEVRLVDWQVQIVDRDSMNHTFIEVPGRSPLQLRPAEPYPIPPGTVVNLADAVRFTYDTA